MSYTRPVIVSGSTRLTKELIDGITQGIAMAAVAESSTPALTRVRLARRYEDPVRLVVFADSRGEGVTPNPATEGITGWDKTFPSLVAQMMRNELGLPAGGRGWIPLALTDDAAAYRFTVSSFEAGTPAPVVGDTGVPGSQWMVPERTIRVPLSAGCTSVALVSAPSGGGGYATKLTGQKAGRVRDWGQDGASGFSWTRSMIPELTWMSRPVVVGSSRSVSSNMWAMKQQACRYSTSLCPGLIRRRWLSMLVSLRCRRSWIGIPLTYRSWLSAPTMLGTQ